MKRLPVRPAGGGFTLVELLVVIGVISLLVALLLPIVADAPKRANRLRCASNLGQIYRGARLYSNEAQGMLPDLYAGISTDFAKQDARYRTSHYARNTDASGQEVPCGLWLLVSRHYAETPNVLYCPGTPPGRRFGGTLNPAVNDIPQMAGFAYNCFPDTTSKPIPWNAASTVPGGSATRTFSDDLPGYTAVRDAWMALFELRR